MPAVAVCKPAPTREPFGRMHAAHHTPRQDILQLFRHYQSVIARDALCGVNQNRHNFLNVLQKQSDKISAANISSAPAPLQDLHHYYGLLRPCTPHRYSQPRGWSRLWLVASRHRRDGAQVLTFHTKAWSSFAPPTCRMSPGQSQASPELIPEEDAMGRRRGYCVHRR